MSVLTTTQMLVIEGYELYRGCNMELQAFQRFLATTGVKGYAEQRSNDEARMLVLYNIKV